MKSPSVSRRRFLRATAVSAVGFPFVSTLLSRAADAEPRKLGFALVGLGGLSNQQLAPALKLTKFCRLAGIVTGTPSKIPVWKERYNIPDKNVYNYSTMEQMADNPDIDVVYIVTPNGLHAEHSIKGAKAGKHVFCEKPFETSVEKCQQIIDACKKANRMLAVAYRCQFDPNHIECRRLALAKVFGEVKGIEAAFSRGINLGEWRWKKDLAGGGAPMDGWTSALQTSRFVTGPGPIEGSGKFGPVT